MTRRRLCLTSGGSLKEIVSRSVMHGEGDGRLASVVFAVEEMVRRVELVSSGRTDDFCSSTCSYALALPVELRVGGGSSGCSFGFLSSRLDVGSGFLEAPAYILEST